MTRTLLDAATGIAMIAWRRKFAILLWTTIVVFSWLSVVQ